MYSKKLTVEITETNKLKRHDIKIIRITYN